MKVSTNLIAIATLGVAGALACSSGKSEPETPASAASEEYDEADAVIGPGTETQNVDEVRYPHSEEREGYSKEELEENQEDPEVD